MGDVVLRQARYDDAAAVADLRTRVGLGPAGPPEDWDWLCRANPGADDTTHPGWVLEHGTKVVGFLGVVWRTYSFEGRTLRSAAARMYIVDPAYRHESLRLVAAFFAAPADLLVNTSANEAAARVFRVAGARMLPQAGYQDVLFWVLSARGAITAWLRDRDLPPRVARTAGLIGGAVAQGIVGWRGASFHGPADATVRYDPAGLGPNFDRFWRDLCLAHPDRLLACRDSAALRWQWGAKAARRREPVVLAAERGGDLEGFVVLTREDSERVGLARARVVDIISKGDHPDTLRALLSAAYREARRQQVDVLEMVGFPPAVRRVAESFRPLHRTVPHCPFWYAARQEDLARALADAAPWYASPFDGDAAL